MQPGELVIDDFFTLFRRSLKEDLRVNAERRGESELRFAKWEVRTP